MAKTNVTINLNDNFIINDKQLDAIHSYIQRLELYLLDAGIQLPSNREDVDWELFEKYHH